MKLETRAIPLVSFHRDLPGYLSKSEKAFIRVEAQAAGAVNPQYTAGVEQLLMKAQVIDRKAAKIDDDEGHVAAQASGRKAVALERFGVLYDACISSWETDILDGGKPMKCNRQNFLALCDARVPEISAAITELEAECLQVGKAVLEQAEDTIKN